MKVFVIGGGGREHCLVWKLKKSKSVKKIWCAPGNGGIAQDAECVNISPLDLEGLVRFAYDNKIDLTLVGPEAPLAEGIVDIFEKEKLCIFGPKKEAALLEASKAFCKEMLKRWKVLVPKFRIFDSYEEALKYIENESHPLVIKADGLCAGKGSVVCEDLETSKKVLKEIMLDRIFGDAGKKVVIEEFLEGTELSVLAVSDGKNFVCFSPSQDHKKIYDGDKGPNTGGMGAYSPTPFVTPQLFEEIKENIIKKTLQGMYKDVTPFKGVLYAGLMLTNLGVYVLEFNVRFGDPETQSILPRLKNDLLEIVIKSLKGELENYKMWWDEKKCICVVLASKGYPLKYEKGFEIKGLEKFKDTEDIIIFHAGTKKADSKFLTNGGRVLNVCALDKDFKSTYEKVYRAVKEIYFENMYYRTDIAKKVIDKKV